MSKDDKEEEKNDFKEKKYKDTTYNNSYNDFNSTKCYKGNIYDNNDWSLDDKNKKNWKKKEKGGDFVKNTTVGTLSGILGSLASEKMHSPDKKIKKVVKEEITRPKTLTGAIIGGLLGSSYELYEKKWKNKKE